MRIATIIAAMLLTACNERESNICSEVPARLAYAPAITGKQVRENANRCVQHWAARLSLGTDEAKTVAEAAIAACREGLDDALAYSINDEEQIDQPAWERRLYDLALFRVVQQRAGNCGIPPLGEMPEPSKGSQEAGLTTPKALPKE